MYQLSFCLASGKSEVVLKYRGKKPAVEMKQSKEKCRGELPQWQSEYTMMTMMTVVMVKSITYSLQWSKKGSGRINVASLRLPFILSFNTASTAEQRCYYISDPKNEPADLLTFNPTWSHAAI